MAGPFAPEDNRTLNANGAVAYPCLYTANNNLKHPTTDIELKFTTQNTSIKLTNSGSPAPSP